MIAETPCERKALKKFRSYVLKHAKPLEDSAWAVRVHHHHKERKTLLGEEVSIPENDAHHVISTPLMCAISHAIEDMAMEAGQGELIATFQNLSEFVPVQDRYRALARKLDYVRIWGEGVPPKGCRDIDFITTFHPKVSRYWMVLFDSPKFRAILFSKQVNRTSHLPDRKFVGFYSFNPYLVQSIRWRFNLLSCGLVKVVNLWEKSFPLPEVKQRDLEAYLTSRNGKGR